MALAIISDREKSYDQELFKKYKKEEMSYPEGEGVQFIRELRALSEIFTISLIRRFNEIHKFTEEEVKKLREYIVVSNDLSNNMSRLDEYMNALSNLIKNPALSVKEIFESNNRLVTIMHNTALIDLIMSGKLQPGEAREKSCKDLEELICTEYKDSHPIPLKLPPKKKAPESKVEDVSLSQREHEPAMSK